MGAFIISVNISDKKGMKKKPVSAGLLEKAKGLSGDIHAEGGIRQLSLLAMESIAKMKAKGHDVKPGDFAENLTTSGIDLINLPLGTLIKTTKGCLLKLSKKGKECHHHCEIYRQAGSCVMPTEGVFCEILEGGPVLPGDGLEVIQ